MVSKEETATICRFVRGQLRDKPDLSTLTLGIFKKRYLALVGCESLSPEAKNYMKQVVEEELMKMQGSDESGEDEVVTKRPQKKRKREKEDDEVINEREEEKESRAKKSRPELSSSSESEDKEGYKSGSEESEGEDQMKSASEDAEPEVRKPQHETNRKHKQLLDNEDSTDEEVKEAEDKGEESKSSDSPKQRATKKENSSRSPEKKTKPSDKNKTAVKKSERSDKVSSNESSDDSEKEEKVSVEKEKEDTDSDSSSVSSQEDDKHSRTEDNQHSKKKKTVKKEKSAGDKRVENKKVAKLKHYIAVCGVRRNYKKLFEGCPTINSKVAVLKKELKDLGVDGDPTIKKCKKAREKLEQAKEIAGLDVSNIITTQGRSTRRQLQKEQDSCQSSTYQRTLNSSSGSDQENDPHRGSTKVSVWANLRGVISDDADSD